MFDLAKILGLLLQAALFIWNFFKKRKEIQELVIPLKQEDDARLENEKLLNAKSGDGSAAWLAKLSDRENTH